MLHEHTGGDKNQQQTGNEAVNTGGLGQSDTQDHGAGNVALALGIAADDFTGTGGAVTFADTRADTGDQSQTGADAATCQMNRVVRVQKMNAWMQPPNQSKYRLGMAGMPMVSQG